MKISETGRSMVEMLGVLAIMGVLTVGVMLGYRYAMDRILTNSIITGVRARSVIIGQQRVLGQPLNLSEFHPDTEKDLIYGRFEVKAFNNYEYDGEESQAMEVYNIPRRVCENIRMLTFPDETITLVNGSEMGECITDGERENTGGLHDGGDYFRAEYHNVVTFIFAGLGEACSVNQDCQEGLCCVRLEEGDRGCLPCESPTDCDPCQEWNGETCVNKAEDSQCLWKAGATGCCKSGVCGACPNMCLGQSCDTLCQTCDSETGACVNKDNGTDCGTCKRCENGKCVPDMTLPGCTECDAVIDCNGVCGGGAVEDCNGVCGGSAVEDCNGVCGGTAKDEGCGCGNGPKNEDGCCDNLKKDCAGVCGGNAIDTGCGCGKTCNPCHESENPCADGGGCNPGCQECVTACNSDGQWAPKECVPAETTSCGIVCGRECFASPIYGEFCTCAYCHDVWEAAREEAKAKDPCNSCTGECETCTSNFDEESCSWSGGECKTDEACMCKNAGGEWI